MNRMIICSVYDKELKTVGCITVWKSLLRTYLLRGAGKFELKCPAIPEIISLALQGYFIRFHDDESCFLIESVEPDLLQDSADTVVIGGRDLKALTALRVVWGMQQVSGTAWNRMYWLLYYQCIEPKQHADLRKIPYLQTLEYIGTDAGEVVEAAQYTGDNVYDACVEILGTDRSYGWRMYFDWDAQEIKNEFYSGSDKTASIQFHSLLGNLKNVQYLRDIADYANVAIIGGEGEGSARKWQNVGSDSYTGLDRRELFVDARDLSSESTDDDGNTTTLTVSQYNAVMQNRGQEKLSDHTISTELEFDVLDGVSATWKEDYDLGDTVKVVNTDKLGISATARVIGVQVSDDSDGRSVTPTVELVSMEVLTT